MNGHNRLRPFESLIMVALVAILAVPAQSYAFARPAGSGGIDNPSAERPSDTKEGSDKKAGKCGSGQNEKSETGCSSEGDSPGVGETGSLPKTAVIPPGMPSRSLFQISKIQTSTADPQAGTGQQPRAATPGPARQLSLQEAVNLAIQNNLTTEQSREARKEAHGQEIQSLSGLLPNISGAASQASVTSNLASFGFTPGLFPGIQSTFIGPFRIFDARVKLVQTIFDLTSIRNYQAGRAGVRIANLRNSLAEQQVTTQTAIAYLNDLRAHRAVESAQADLALANSLLKQAQDQHDAGVATGVDVTRAETRVAEEQLAVARAQRDAHQARLQLLREVGLPLGSEVVLTDPLQFTNQAPIATLDAVSTAEQNRVEVQIASEQVNQNRYEKQSAQAEQLPSLQFLGDYGDSGITPSLVDLPTRSVIVKLNVPIFNGGLTRGRIESAGSRLRQSELFLNDVRAQVEEDVRLAQQDLTTAVDEVNSANQSFDLAQRELTMARDRFLAGVGDNIEVLNAQTALANARQAQISALTDYNAARINLAAALGQVKTFRLQ